jgi:hypothetical protein
MDENPSWEANSHSASREIPSTSTELEVSLLCSNDPTAQPNLNQMHPVHIFSNSFYKAHSDIIFSHNSAFHK